MAIKPGETSQPPKTRHAPLKVVTLYILVAAAWFIVADGLLLLFVPTAERVNLRRALEGWIFVLFSASLLFFLVRYTVRLVHRRETRLREILLGLSITSGEKFYVSLVENLAATFGADAALLCEFPGGDAKRLRILAGWSMGKRMPPHECTLQEDGPCLKILHSKEGYFQVRRLEKNFACPGWPQEEKRGSFEGAPLFDSRGKVIGVLTLLHTRPLHDPKLAEELLPFIALQAAAELERRRAEEALRSSEERFRSVFATAAAGMVIMTPDGSIMQSNPAFREFLGYSEAELTRMNIADLMHPADRDRTRSDFDSLRRGEREVLHYEKRYLARNGATVWGHASVACLLGVSDSSAYCIGLVQDITERVQSEEELRRVNKELDAFVYTVSHDLRSPLTPIIGYSDYLYEFHRQKFDQKTLDMLKEIRHQGEKMLALLEDLLVLARVGKLECPRSPVASGQVVDEVVRDLRERSVKRVPEVQVVTPLPIVGVPGTLLSQIFCNLLGNAVEYGGDSEAIEIGGERRQDRVRYFVRDHGPGVPEPERDGIFEAFYRGSTGRGKAGTGIGLAIVQKVARIYQGRAWVEETPGGGATFWVEMIDDCYIPISESRAAGQS